MKVNFRRTGGFAATAIGCALDTEALPSAEADELEMLIKQSGILQRESAKIAGARDVHYYTVDIEGADIQAHSVTFDDPSIPPEVQPLFDFLVVRSKNLMPDI